jgi:hypothetical protein
MNNIHLIKTDKPSRLQQFKGVNEIEFELCSKNEFFNKRNIYITSDEEIQKGDWVLGDFPDNPIGKVISKYGQEFTAQSLNGDKYGLAEYDSKKIILTTDLQLIADGVQAIDDEFLEWFVKNPSCETVVIHTLIHKNHFGFDKHKIGYKIFIPKEEPKQSVEEYTQQGLEKYAYELEPKQETLEEAAKSTTTKYINEREKQTAYLEFIEGAKWQQEQDKNKYSEVFEWLAHKDYLSDEVEIIQKEFNQFKNK